MARVARVRLRRALRRALSGPVERLDAVGRLAGIDGWSLSCVGDVDRALTSALPPVRVAVSALAGEMAAAQAMLTRLRQRDAVRAAARQGAPVVISVRLMVWVVPSQV